jgi:hypothetical protein
MRVVAIVVEGGVIQGIDCPRGVKVVVKDYDVDGEDNVHQDENGDEYIEGIWEYADATV